MGMTPVFHKLSWDEFASDCQALYLKMQQLQFDRIVSISRGGNVVSRILSDLCGGIPITHITASSYHDLKKYDTPRIIECPDINLAGQRILVVDEVSDTGATFELLTEFCQTKQAASIHTAAPYIKPKTTHIPNFWTCKIDAWIIFPYDIRETAEGFEKLFGKSQAHPKLLEVGFVKHELELLTAGLNLQD